MAALKLYVNGRGKPLCRVVDNMNGNNKMTIAIGRDHRDSSANDVIIEVLEARGLEVADLGTYSDASCDYNDFGEAVASGVETGKYKLGIVICGSGIGMGISANRFPHVRAAQCNNAELARTSRIHNNSNVLALVASL